ncbi:hypothetical protein BDV59DRAFT_128217 [Aspergillus ambiguus]|uniref:uncharacterized protein n=1 Tax=Aspergillus ambiguus TaxID=176160 RepID=UPI003CCCD3C0
MSSRSKARSRPRRIATTDDSLHHLNTINNNSKAVRHSLPAPSRRAIAVSVDQPRSDDVFSHGEVPENEPRTPRRSVRFQKTSPPRSTPTRRSLRLQNDVTSKGYELDVSRHSSEEGSGLESEQDEPVSQDKVVENVEDDDGHVHEGLENFSQVNFYDENDSVPSMLSETGQLHTPRIITELRLSQKDVHESVRPDGDGNNSAGLSTPGLRSRTPQQDTRPASSHAIESPNFQVNNAEPTATFIAGTPVAGSEENTVSNSKPPVQSPKKVRFPDITAENHEHGIQMSNTDQASSAHSRKRAVDTEDGEFVARSNSENRSESSSSDSEFSQPSLERDRSPSISGKKRRTSDNRPQSTNSDGDLGTQEVQSNVSASFTDTHHEDEPENGPIDDFWFTKAAKLGGQQQTWHNLMSNIRAMGAATPSHTSSCFKNIKAQISQLHSLYQEILNNLNVFSRIPNRVARQCIATLENIKGQGDILFSRVRDRATATQKGSLEDTRLLTEFEGRVIARMVKLNLLPCFQIYYQSPGQLSSHFAEIINVLVHFVAGVSCLTRDYHVWCKNRSKIMLRPLKQLLRALNMGYLFPMSLKQHHYNGSKNYDKSWTKSESQALMTGLRKYKGPERYRRIINMYGDQLIGRTPDELRAEARRIYDRLLPDIEANSDMPDVLELYDFLLSVPTD